MANHEFGIIQNQPMSKENFMNMNQINIAVLQLMIILLNRF